MDAASALEKLRQGNQTYINSDSFCGDTSLRRMQDGAVHGQKPYAVVVGCSDSRVIPEAIFSAQTGEIFVIRVAGNVLDDVEYASVEYATKHLGAELVLILGHTHCGAVDAAISGDSDGELSAITDVIADAIGGVKDDIEACRLNVIAQVERLKEKFPVRHFDVAGGLYHMDDKTVEFL